MFCGREPEGKEWARPQEAGTGTNVSELERRLKGLCGGWRSRLNHLSFLALLQNRLMLDSNCEAPGRPARVTRAASARGGPATWSSSAAGTALSALPDPPRLGLAVASNHSTATSGPSPAMAASWG